MSDNYTSEKEQSSIKQYVPLILILFIATILVIFAVQNSHEIAIKLIFRTVNVSLSLALLISIFIGVIMTLVYSISLLQKKNKRIKEMKAYISELKKYTKKETGNKPEEKDSGFKTGSTTELL